MKNEAADNNTPEKWRLLFIHGHPAYIAKGYHYAPHAHPFHELVLIQEGRYLARVSGKDYMAGRGDILLYTSGTIHEEWPQDDLPVLVWTCSFQWDGFDADEPVLRRDANGLIQELLARINHLKQIDRQHLCPPVLRAILLELRRLNSGTPHAMVDRVRAFVYSNIQTKFTLDELADVAGLSKCHFVRQYRAVTGHPPMEDVRRLRVEEARELIITTNLLLKEIAPLVGLSDEYQLSRLLRRYLGVSTRKLRKSEPPQ